MTDKTHLGKEKNLLAHVETSMIFVGKQKLIQLQSPVNFNEQIDVESQGKGALNIFFHHNYLV